MSLSVLQLARRRCRAATANGDVFRAAGPAARAAEARHARTGRGTVCALCAACGLWHTQDAVFYRVTAAGAESLSFPSNRSALRWLRRRGLEGRVFRVTEGARA